MTVISKIISFLTFLVMLLNGTISMGTNPQTTEDVGNTILFFSDYQGSSRSDNLTNLLAAVDVTPDLIVCGGDYQSYLATSTFSEYGMDEIKEIISSRWDSELQYIFVQGNHDPAGVDGLTDTGLYEFDAYYILVIGEDDFPWNQGLTSSGKKTVQTTAQWLEGVLSELAAEDTGKPVFITTHVPLHYTTRTSLTKDNSYANYIFDVVNEYGQYLDIIFMVGHNHSGTYDDYVGGSVIYLDIGDTITVAGMDEDQTLNFIYMNYGYSGYSYSTNTETSTNILTVAAAVVYDDRIEITRYSEAGVYCTYDITLNTALAA
ncbi:MAG: metallophosphoesterase [Clostridiales bacterium]|nr:metallophosphoesterase [Clostridiales bacterium]